MDFALRQAGRKFMPPLGLLGQVGGFLGRIAEFAESG